MPEKDGIGHFEIVSYMPLPRKAEHAREAECVIVWVRSRDGAQGWRGRVGRARAFGVGSDAGLNVLP